MTVAEFRNRFVEFANVSDEKIQMFLDDATSQVNPKCGNSELMIAYLTAHLLTLSLRTDSGISSPLKEVTNKTVEGVSIGYATSSQDNSGYGSTSYGQRYMQLKKGCISILVG